MSECGRSIDAGLENILKPREIGCFICGGVALWLTNFEKLPTAIEIAMILG